MKRSASFFSLFVLVFCMAAFPARAANENLALFVKSSAYGAAIGAGAGTATLAFSDKPSNNLNQIARGASLGLYVGMAVGLYLINREPRPGTSVDHTSLWISPASDGLVAGLDFSF